MGLFDFFRSAPKGAPGKHSAQTAKERLQILLAHERKGGDGADFLPLLQKDILAAISKYLPIDQDKVIVKLERGSSMSTLEVNVEIPAPPTRAPGESLATRAMVR